MTAPPFVVGEFAEAVPELYVIDRQAAADSLSGAGIGAAEVRLLLQARSDAGRIIRKSTKDEPLLCVACARPIKRLTPDTILGVIRPNINKPFDLIGFAFCRKCAPDRSELVEKATAGLREIWPGKRIINVITVVGGRA